MEPSLTIIVPVRNAESALEGRIQRLLETAEDSAAHFEILLVDDGSEDQTEDVAHELSRRYPQVRVVRHYRSSGMDAAVRTGLLHSRGNVVFIHDSGELPGREELQAFCDLGGNKHLVVGGKELSPLYLRPDLISRLQTWGMMVASQKNPTSASAESLPLTDTPTNSAQSHVSPVRTESGIGWAAALPTSSTERR